MSGKRAKALRRVQEKKNKDFKWRRKMMLEELKKLSRLHRIDLRGALQYTPQGIVPLIAFVDMKDQYEQVVKGKGNGELKRRKLKI